MPDPEQKSHRTAWIAGGAAGAVVAAALYGGRKGYRLRGGKRGHLIDAIKDSGAAEELERQAEARRLQHAAKKATEGRIEVEALKIHHDLINNGPEHHMQTAHEVTKAAQYPIAPTAENYQHVTTARTYAVAAAQKHAQAALHNPAIKDYVYWAPPFDAENPPKPGRFYHPDVAHKKNLDWSREKAKEIVHADIAKRPAQVAKAVETRGIRVPGVKDKRGVEHTKSTETDWRIKINPTGSQQGKGKPKELARQVVDFLHEFDIRIKENRGRNGQFSSKNGPQSSPLDMQQAYHAPLIRQHAERHGISTGAKVAIAGIGAAAGVGALILGNPALKRKMAGKVVADAQASIAPVDEALKKLPKGSRAALESSFAERLRSDMAAKDARHAAMDAKKDLMHAHETSQLRGHLENAQAIAATAQREKNLAKTSYKNLRERTEGLREIAETHQRAAESGGTPSVLEHRVPPFGTRSVPIYTHKDALQKLRITADFHLEEAQRSAQTAKNRLAEAKADPASTPHKIAMMEVEVKHRVQRHAEHLDHSRRLGEISKIENPISLTHEMGRLQDEMWHSRKDVARRIAEEQEPLKVANQLKPKKPALPFGDVVSISQTGAPAVEGRGVGSKRGGKKKNTKNFDMSDARLATNLVVALGGTVMATANKSVTFSRGEPVLPKETMDAIEQVIKKMRERRKVPNISGRTNSSSSGILPLFGR
jgi:hypothetical protein